MNGTYKFAGTHDGRPYFSYKPSHGEMKFLYWHSPDNRWIIGLMRNGNRNLAQSAKEGGELMIASPESCRTGGWTVWNGNAWDADRGVCVCMCV